jgi:hypothetical protein
MAAVRIVLAFVACCLALGIVPVNAVAETPKDEYELKALFLYNFARFSQWPNHDARTMRFCISADHETFSRILAALEKRSVGTKPVKVRKIRQLSESAECDLLFLSSTRPASMKSGVSGIGPHVLTVGEDPEFILSGGMIRFYMEDERIRFEINRAAVKQSDVILSSKLLSLGKIVSDDSKGGQ